MNLPPEEFIFVTEEAELEFGGGKDSEMTNDAWRNWAAGDIGPFDGACSDLTFTPT